jgi:hypothetical protein
LAKEIFYADCVSDCPSENIGEKCNYNSNNSDITKANVRCKERSSLIIGSIYELVLEEGERTTKQLL